MFLIAKETFFGGCLCSCVGAEVMGALVARPFLECFSQGFKAFPRLRGPECEKYAPWTPECENYASWTPECENYAFQIAENALRAVSGGLQLLKMLCAQWLAACSC